MHGAAVFLAIAVLSPPPGGGERTDLLTLTPLGDPEPEPKE